MSPTQSILDKAEREAEAKRRELLDSAAYRVIHDPNISAERAEVILLTEHRKKNGAAQSTVDALMYSLRRGLSALGPTDPLQGDTLRRLSELSKAQIKDCCEKLKNRKLPIGAAWNKEELIKLVEVWRKVRS